tara:strand:- start:980 stop:1183 length:204 start_codon:yes stop_codon:yes gene_type:complete
VNIEKELSKYQTKAAKLRTSFVNTVSNVLSAKQKRIGAIAESVVVLNEEYDQLFADSKELINVMKEV